MNASIKPGIAIINGKFEHFTPCTPFELNDRTVIGFKENHTDGDPTTNCKICHKDIYFNKSIRLYVQDRGGKISRLFASCKCHGPKEQEKK